MLKAGYTSVCEFHYVHHQANGQPYAQASLLSERIVAAAEKTGIGLTMLPVLYQYSGFGAQPPRADQPRFINTPEQLMALLETLRPAYHEGPQRRYHIGRASGKEKVGQDVKIPEVGGA